MSEARAGEEALCWEGARRAEQGSLGFQSHDSECLAWGLGEGQSFPSLFTCSGDLASVA